MWFQSLQKDIGGNFKERVTYEEYGQAEVILGVGHIQICQQLPLNYRSKDITP